MDNAWTILLAIAGPVLTLIAGYIFGSKRKAAAATPVIVDARTDAQKAQDAAELRQARADVVSPPPASRARLEAILRESEIATGHLDRSSRPPPTTH